MKCAIAHCLNELKPKARLPECQACRNVFRYWYRRPTSAVIARQDSLAKWQERMIQLIQYPRGKKHVNAVRKTIKTQLDRRA